MSLRKFAICATFLVPVVAFGKNKSIHDTFTGQGYGTAGCGLGSVLLGDKPGMVQIFAATTNATFGNQTFGISSGTLNCEETTSAHAFRKKLNRYVVGNHNQLQNDIAKASGESIRALETMGGCKHQLGPDLQKQYGKIFSDNNSENVSQRIYDLMASTQCQV